jgi:hypothetical protein
MSFLDDVWSTINWLAITIPFILAYSVFQYCDLKHLPKFVAYFMAVAVFVVMLAIYYFIYPILGFPAWMRWFVG